MVNTSNSVRYESCIKALLWGAAALFILAMTPSSFAQNCQWLQVANDGPSARYGHAMVYDSVRRQSIVFGGSFDFLPLHDDTWVWNGQSWTEVNLNGTRPDGRRRHCMAFDSRRGVAVLFGGLVSNGGQNASNETWEWDGAAWTRRDVQGPSARMDAAMAYDSARGVVVLFGGRNEFTREVYGDTWLWNGSTWTEQGGPGPTPRAVPGAAMAFDAARGECVLFGGETSQGVPYQDTWTLNSEGWTFEGDDAPSARSQTTLAYDGRTERVMLFGGWRPVLGYADETWCWDGARWQQIQVNAPPARAGHAMAFDERVAECIMFGGANAPHSPLNDTWAFRCGIQLFADGTCPGGGPIQVSWSGATPNGQVALIFAVCEGDFVVPARNPCQGTQLGLCSTQIQLVGIYRSDANGSRQLNGFAGNGACGKFLQLLDLTTCDTSNVAPIE